MTAKLELVATCARGLEPLVQEELTALGATDLHAGIGAVNWTGGWPDVWRAAWRLRCANRVLVKLGGWSAASEEALYKGANRLAWSHHPELFSPDRSLSIQASHLRELREERQRVGIEPLVMLMSLGAEAMGQPLIGRAVCAGLVRQVLEEIQELLQHLR